MVTKTINDADGNPIAVTTDGARHVVVANSLISHHWAGAGLGNAPDPSGFGNYVVGVDNDGAAVGLVYHVIDGAWEATGATVANLYGG